MVNYAEDYAKRLGGFVQKKFDNIGPAGGISLGIHGAIVEDGYGVTGQYKGVEFTLAFSNETPTMLRFHYTLKLPKKMEGLGPEREGKDMTRLLGHAITEYNTSLDGKPTCEISCDINESPHSINQPEDLFGDLWNYVVKKPLGKATGLIK